MKEKESFRDGRSPGRAEGRTGRERPARPRGFVPAPEDGSGSGARIEGRNAVLEALKAGRTIDKLFVTSGDTDGTLSYIVALARKSGAAVSRCDRRKLDAMSETGAHQGVIAMAAARGYSTVDEMLAKAESQKKMPLLVLCDGITDPHNLGAIIRTAEVSGAHGVIIPRNRSVGLTPVVDKASAGALEYMPVARVSNLAACIADLKKRGIWVFASASRAETGLYEADFLRPCAVVIGSEGDGVSRVVYEACDYTVRIPMFGRIGSLNASNAAAVLLYEAVRQRAGASARTGDEQG